MTKRNINKCPKTKIFTTKHTNATKQGFMPKSQLFNPCKPFSSTYFTQKNAYKSIFSEIHTDTHNNTQKKLRQKQQKP